jgi:hypothetical protein
MGSTDEDYCQAIGLNSYELPKQRLIVSPAPPYLGISLSTIPVNVTCDSWTSPSFPHPAHSSHDYTVKSATLIGTGSNPKCGVFLSREQ